MSHAAWMGAIVTAGGLLLLGCGNKEEPKTPEAVEQDTEKAGDKVEQGVEEAGEELEQAGDEIQQETKDEE